MRPRNKGLKLTQAQLLWEEGKLKMRALSSRIPRPPPALPWTPGPLLSKLLVQQRLPFRSSDGCAPRSHFLPWVENAPQCARVS